MEPSFCDVNAGLVVAGAVPRLTAEVLRSRPGVGGRRWHFLGSRARNCAWSKVNRREMADPRPDRLALATAARLHGVITTAQLAHAGLSKDAVTDRVRRGWLRRLH